MANDENLKPQPFTSETAKEAQSKSVEVRKENSEKQKYIDFLLKTDSMTFDAEDIMYIRKRIGSMTMEELLALEKNILPSDVAEELSAKLASIMNGENNQNEKRINREIGKEKTISEITGRDGQPITFQDARTALLERINQLRGSGGTEEGDTKP